MNIEEIRKRAEEMKKPDPLYFSTYGVWAADTILQLVAEVELNESTMAGAITKIEKLTAANKIMREGLEYINDTLAVVDVERDEDEGMTWAESAIYKVATQSAKEADEVIDDAKTNQKT